MYELLPNKIIEITIPFYHILFHGLAIPFPNGMVIPQTKQGHSYQRQYCFCKKKKKRKKEKEEEKSDIYIVTKSYA
jgi:hypothetical protein